jgi:hypothetical protein
MCIREAALRGFAEENSGGSRLSSSWPLWQGARIGPRQRNLKRNYRARTRVKEQDEYELVTGTDAAAFLMRVHYGFFMSNPHFWYEPTLMEADGIICRLASELRMEAKR